VTKVLSCGDGYAGEAMVPCVPGGGLMRRRDMLESALVNDLATKIVARTKQSCIFDLQQYVSTDTARVLSSFYGAMNVFWIRVHTQEGSIV
jgi:plasmid maintenance system antidote protein VapI